MICPFSSYLYLFGGLSKGFILLFYFSSPERNSILVVFLL